MNTSKAVSLAIRGLALGLALMAVVGRDSSAKGMALQAPPVVVVPNLVAHWEVDTDTPPTANDSTANFNTGTYSPGGSPATTSSSIFAPVPAGNTRSFQFSQAQNQFIAVADSPSISLTGSFTLAAWIRPTVDSAVQEGIIEKYDDTPAIGNGYSFRLSNAEHLSFSVYSGTTQYSITSSPRTVPLNAWTHVAGVYDMAAQTMVMYKSDNDASDMGAPDPTQLSSVPAPTNGSQQLQIGKDYGANAFNGNMDGVRIYNRALTQAEIIILRDGQPAPGTLFIAAGPGMNQLTWTAPAGAPAGITYSVLSGPSTGNYTTVVNGINTTTYDDTSAAPGVPTFYAVVAVTVMASPRTNEVSGIPGPAGPPPPPPPPRTSKVGGEDNPCGCGSTSLPGGWTALFGLALLVGLTLARKA
jgi:hypothetical protein